MRGANAASAPGESRIEGVTESITHETTAQNALAGDSPPGPAGKWLGELFDPGDWSRFGPRLLARDLVELSRCEATELVAEFGLALPDARRLRAAFALGRELRRARRPPRPCLRSARAVFEWLDPEARGLVQEHFWSLLLDGKQRLIRHVLVSTGTLTSSLVHPREVFRAAIREAAAALIVVHNHPSGDPEPSAEDLEVTERLRRAGEVLGIPLQDHVILGDRSFVSLQERARLAPRSRAPGPG